MISIGDKNDILFIIRKEENSNYGVIDLIINNFKIIEQQSGNLSFLCADAECVTHNFARFFDDNFFWENEDNILMENWSLFYNARTIEEMDNPKVRDFNDRFFNVKISLDSEFFDEYIFIGYNNKTNFLLKAWKKDQPQSILNFEISSSNILRVFEELEEALSWLLD